ncbi:hypothetical protein OG738_40560 [Amycolatopsis sp. NBC_01488]|uniref:hypothetical protein n=1 Tax=Amycolatopsis sp. NBC_01488 TaxID=2903563 RepID=UPI002E2B8D23|nr:hypothetical protein [Amycolatopsis sp. NBC_01488]
MSPLALASIETVPRVLLLLVGVLGLIFSVKGRARGVSGLMVGAFLVMVVTTTAGIAWQYVSLDAPSWMRSSRLSFDEITLIFLAVRIPLDVLVVLSWLLVAIAVVKSGRPPRQPGFAPYPMAAQPDIPPPGYTPPGHPQQQPN